MVDILGYLALAVSLFSIGQKKMKRFRWFHLFASALYLGYGILIQAAPLIVGAALFLIIHSYRLLQLYTSAKKN